MEDEKRSNVVVTVKWNNPYTNKEEEIDIFLPDECIDRHIKDYFKKAFDIDISDIDKFIQFLEQLGRAKDSLEEFPDLMDICIEDYYKTPFYEEDKKDALDEYEMFNNLGDYSEDDDYVE